MAKRPKQKQTEWNIQGKQLADTAVPYYQSNLGRVDRYLANPQGTMEDYLSRYYDNSVEQSDFLRNYNRAMSGLTGHNYAATGGGYDTSNQRMYDDQQRYMNDLAARLRDKGITSAYNMATGDYAKMLAANQAYRNAYALGQPYSDVDQYNYQVGQTNKWYNQLGGLLGTAGAAIGGAFGGGTGASIGASLGNTLGNAFTMDIAGSPTSGMPYANMGTNALVNYYNQQSNLPTATSLRGGGQDTTSAGQFVNTEQQTKDFFSNNTRLNPLPNSVLMQNMRKRGLLND